MLATSKRLNLLPQLLPLQEIFIIFGPGGSKLVHFCDNNKRQLEGFSRYLETFW